MATLLDQSGATARMIADQLGHAPVSMRNRLAWMDASLMVYSGASGANEFVEVMPPAVGDAIADHREDRLVTLLHHAHQHQHGNECQESAGATVKHQPEPRKP